MRDERQKPLTEEGRKKWDDIFKKKEEKPDDTRKE